jgi:HNH endonuclease
VRRKIPVDVRQQVLHEAGYKCANPICGTVLTLDIHHMEYVSEGGSNEASNLLPLCPNCHTLHHLGEIPSESIRAWKMLLLSLNEAFDRRQVELLLMLDKVKALWITSDSAVNFAGLLASGMVCLYEGNYHVPITHYHVALSEKGQTFVSSWKSGAQKAAVQAAATGDTRAVLPFGIGAARHQWGEPSSHASDYWESKEKETDAEKAEPQEP